MKNRTIARAFPGIASFAFGLLLVALLASCGGGGTTVAGVDSGGTGNTVVAGPVSGLGSAIVNGVRLDVSSAVIVDDEGNTLTADQIVMGMVAKVDASAVVTTNGEQTATATNVQIRSQVVGPVESVNLSASSLVVLGQTIQVTPATWFDTALTGGFSTSLVGAVVEVYGQFDPISSQYVATRITQHLDHSAYKISGILLAMDATKSTLNIGGLVISYSAIAPASVPALVLGDFVKVRLSPKPVGTVWNALAVVLGHLNLQNSNDVRMTGRITAWKSAQNFSMEGIPVNASSAAFSGATSGVVLGARVTITGSSSKGILNATTVTVNGTETLANSIFEVHGAIATLDTALQTLSLHGVTVFYSGQTAFQAGTAADLSVTRKIKVLGVLAADRSSVQAQTIVFE